MDNDNNKEHDKKSILISSERPNEPDANIERFETWVPTEIREFIHLSKAELKKLSIFEDNFTIEELTNGKMPHKVLCVGLCKFYKDKAFRNLFFIYQYMIWQVDARLCLAQDDYVHQVMSTLLGDIALEAHLANLIKVDPNFGSAAFVRKLKCHINPVEIKKLKEKSKEVFEKYHKSNSEYSYVGKIEVILIKKGYKESACSKDPDQPEETIEEKEKREQEEKIKKAEKKKLKKQRQRMKKAMTSEKVNKITNDLLSWGYDPIESKIVQLPHDTKCHAEQTNRQMELELELVRQKNIKQCGAQLFLRNKGMRTARSNW